MGRSYLFGLALEALLCLVRPSPCEGRLPRLDHGWVEGVHLPVVAVAGFDCRQNGPTACWRVLEVLLDGVVVFLPTSERLGAQKTHHIVGTLGVRVEEEAGFRKLVKDKTRQSVTVRHRAKDKKQESCPLTATGDSVLCGQCNALGARDVACDTRPFVTSCGP